MRNFLRILKTSWKYRGRLFISLACALCVAALFAMSFTAVFPVLKLLGSGKNLQSWIDEKIDLIDKDIEEAERQVDAFKQQSKVIDKISNREAREEAERRLADDLTRVENQLAAARSKQWRDYQIKHYVIRYLPTDRFQTMALMLGLVVLAVAIKGIFEFGQEYLVGIVTTRTILDLRNRFFQHSIHQDLRQIQEGGSADLMSRMTNDMEMIGNGLKILFGRVVAEPLKAVACVSIACFINWQITLLFILTVPPAFVVMTTASKKMKRASRRLLDRMSNIYKVLQETFQGLRIVKAFTMEPYERRRFHDASRDYAERSMRVIRIDAITSPLVEVAGVLAVSVALLAGSYLVLSGQKRIFGFQFAYEPMEIEKLMTIYTLLIGMADPIRKLSSVYTKVQSAVAACDRVYQTMDQLPQVQANIDGPRIERHSKSIEFHNVCFSYIPEKQVLTNICFTVGAAETVAIVGSNGSGKSTLLNLLPRFYDPDHGTIKIDNIDIRKANLRSLRKQISLVSQDPILFDDTIFNNIRYGSRRSTKEQVEDAAKKAFAHDFIVAKGGYETKLGDLGSGLSGGEKQRIALARAILRDPSILILDEFSSAIDPVSDRLIHDALREIKKGRTTFFITHKMHTLDIADRIIVLDNHTIAAIGTHNELIATSPLYRNLYEAQIQAKAA